MTSSSPASKVRVLAMAAVLACTALPPLVLGREQVRATSAARPYAAPPGPRVTVATWNVRGGSGIGGWVGTAPFRSTTGNCTDRSAPLNAWGAGFIQPFITRDIAADPSVVAFATQEGWGCARSSQMASLLTGWKASPERAGVNLFARHGIVGAWQEFQIEKKGVAGMREDRFLIGAEVCLTADCRRTAHIWSTHLAPADDAHWPVHVQKVLDYLATKPQPSILMGDLNLWKWDQWSPRVTCGAATAPMAKAYDLITRAGYVDAWATTETGPGWTGMTSRRAPRGNTYCGKDESGTPYKRIDYVFVKGMAPADTELFGFTGAGTPHPSDHLGVKASLVIAGADATH